MARKPMYEELEQKVKELEVELKRAEEDLEESEKRFQSFHDTFPLPYQALDENGCFLDMNPSWVEELGYSREEVLGQWFGDFLVPEYRDHFKQFFPRFKAAGEIYGVEFEMLRKDGSTLFISFNGKIAYDKEGRFKQTHRVFQNITARKRVEETLEEKRFKLKEYFENLPLLAYNITLDGKINDINNVVLKRLGYDSKDELIGKSLISTAYAPSSQEKAKRLLEKWERKKILKNEELQIITKQGEIIDVLLNVDTIYDSNGKPLYSLSTQLDITERKKSEEELVRSREELRNLADHLQSVREQERTTIAREIHDDLGQTLTGLKMDLSWLARKVPRDREELLEKIRAMSGLVSTTHKTVQRITTELRPGLLDDLGLAAAMEWQTEEFQSRTGISCKLTIDPEDIVIDEKRSTALFRIFQESLTNISRHAGATRVTVSLKEKDGQIALRVRDNGKGITKEQISSNKSFGIMGIRERVHQFQGKVRISGSPGKGTTVVVEMPIKD